MGRGVGLIEAGSIRTGIAGEGKIGSGALGATVNVSNS